MRIQIIIRAFLLALCTITGMMPLPVTGQSAGTLESYYNNGKELLALKKYGLAMQALNPLTSATVSSPYQKPGSFLFAVAAYQDNQTSLAKDMFLQLATKYPEWEKSDEVYLWLSDIYLGEGDYKNAATYGSKIRSQEISRRYTDIKSTYLRIWDYNKVQALLNEYPADIEVAIALADKILQLPFNEQDRDLLENLVSVHDLDKVKYRIEDNLRSQKKDKYQVAVMLPFMINEIKANPRRITNEFVIELYEGIKVGAAALKSEGINISIHLYDTRKDSSRALELLQLPEMKHMDLIIGPLFPGPVKVVTDFAFKHRINMINPLSGNSSIVEDNPYAYLFMPTDEMIAQRLASYTTENIGNKNAFIFYGTSDRDSVSAFTYRRAIESEGFKVCYMEKISVDNGKKILDILTNTRQIEIEESETESDPFIDASKLQGNFRLSTIDVLVIKPDSIGHVFLSSSEPALVANTLTGLATRGDSIKIVGSERWLEQRVVSLEGLERQDAILAAPTFIDKRNPKYHNLNALYKETFSAYPTKNFYIGYEMMVTSGRLLKKHGSLFQYDSAYKNPIPGDIFQGVFYGKENCNQVLPIAKFDDGEIVPVSPK